ncbi:MAG TPA: RNA polymerase sigma factor [Bacteroidia bacterium]|jgi:RNA polymerase sigma factor (sigma-70 family)|nr:RNA polymerase sigma factor [Bacteroidia bacterium]
MGDNPNYTDINLPIIERCKKGERKAFQELYNLYAKAMFNISVRILNNSDEAEEVLQDSFLKAFQKIESYDKNYSFGVWLKRIVINRSLDVLKKRKLNFVPIDEANYKEEYEEEESIYDVEAIKKCISELPDGYRTVLTLFLFEDFSHKEIGELLNISEGTSKSQYNRAKKKLIELVKQKTVSHDR